MIASLILLISLGGLAWIWVDIARTRRASRRDRQRLWHPLPRIPRDADMIGLQRQRRDINDEKEWRQRVADNIERRKQGGKKDRTPSLLRRQAD